MRFVLLLLVGCAKSTTAVVEPVALPPAPTAQMIAMIPNTDIADTQDNRSVIDFCERYRAAVEAKDAAALIAMASPKYHDEMGTPDAADDLDFAALSSYLRGLFAAVGEIHYGLRYRNVKREEGKITVEISVNATYYMANSKQGKHTKDDSTIVLEVDGDSYKILSGM